MKKFLTLWVLLAGISFANAQQRGSVVLNALGGYTFQDKVSDSYGYGTIKEAFQYGGTLEYYLHPLRSIEVIYQRMDTKLPVWLYNYNGGLQYNPGKEDVAITYILLGGNHYIPTGSTSVFPYGGFGLGVGVVSAKDYNESLTKFAWNFKLGVRLKLSEKVALKLQGSVESVVQAVGGALYFGTGGAGYDVSSYSTIYQFGLGGALCFTLK